MKSAPTPFEMMLVRRTAIASAAIGATVLVLIAYKWTRPLSPIEVIERLEKVSIKTDPAEIRKLCTDQGFELITWGNQSSKGTHTLSTIEYGAPAYAGELCDIPATSKGIDGEMKFRFRLMNQDGWKFHDIYLEQANDRKVDLWLSYCKDHPYLSAIWVNWEELLNAFATGFAIGAGS